MATNAEAIFKSYRVDLMNRVKQGNELALIELGINIVNQAKALAPVDFAQLKNSIQYKTVKKKGGFEDGHNSVGENSGKQFNGQPDGQPDIDRDIKAGELLVGSTVQHAIYQEYGTRDMQPQPFMRPAIQRFTRGFKTANRIALIIDNWVKKTEKRKAPPK